MVQSLSALDWATPSLGPSLGACTAGTLMICEHQQVASGSRLNAKWCKPTAIGCGLANLGNSCFLNSVLQCLAHLPPLANLCLQRQHARSCRTQAANNGAGCICCRVEDQVCRMLQRSSNTVDTPYNIHRALQVLNRSFVKGRQEDAHELLRCLVDAMERALLRQSGIYNPQKPPKYPRTLVNQLFSGILQSQVRCDSCGYASNTWDPFMDLSLELGGCSTLNEALRRFTAVERLDGENKYRCEGCKQLVPACKQMTIYDDPNVLVIHLKRFDGIFGAKIQHVVEFPASLTLEPFICASRKLRRNSFDTGSAGSSSSTHTALRLGGYHSNGDSNSSSSSIANRHQQWRNGMGVGNGCHGSSGNGSPGQQQQQQQHSYQGQGSSSSSNGNSFNSHCSSGSSQRTSRSEYVLQGLLVHQGFTANSGHYFAYCKDGAPPAGAWHCMNDSTVARVEERDVLKQAAYILFYVRTSMKQQAELPQHKEDDGKQQQPAAAAANSAATAAAAAGSAGLKRAADHKLDSDPMIGPQLPPHLKRQRVAEQQQQQQQSTPAPAVASEGVSQQQVIGPSLPPGWKQASNSSSGGSAAVAMAAPPGLPTAQQNSAASMWESSSVRKQGDSTAPCQLSTVQQQQQQQDQCFVRARPIDQHGQQQEQQILRSSSDNGAAAVARHQSNGAGDAARVTLQPQHQQEWQQQPPPALQQQTLPPGLDAETAAAVAAAAQGLKQKVESALLSRECIVKPWLKSQVEQAKHQGLSLAECKATVAVPFRRHPSIVEMAAQLLQQLRETAEGAATGVLKLVS